MRKWGLRLAATSLVIGATGMFAPAASASETTVETIPCEAVLPPSLCAQLGDTVTFVVDTANRVVPIVNETIDRVFVVTDAVYNLVKCTAQGTCPPF
ncbi:MAG TPA: hypothetical protein VG318_10970 [Actinomycetota bacterium]|nr:hypothetical protein [Actinomycetota bacterium]